MSYAYNTHGAPEVGGGLPGLPQRTGGKNIAATGGLEFSESSPGPDWEVLDGSVISNDMFDLGIKSNGFDTSLANLPGFAVGSADITSVTFSQDGKELLATASGSPYVSMWDHDNGVFTNKTAPSGGSFAHSASAFSPLGNQLAIGYGTSPFIRFYTKSASGEWTPLSDPSDLPAAAVSSIVYSPDGAHCAVSTVSTTAASKLIIYKISGNTRTKLTSVPTTLGTGAVRSISYSPDGGRLAIGRASSADITVLNREGDSYTIGTPIPMVASDVSFVLYSKYGDFFAVVRKEKPYVTVWRVDSTPYVVFQSPVFELSNSSMSMDFGKDNKTLYISSGPIGNRDIRAYSIFGDSFELMSSSGPIDAFGVTAIPDLSGTVIVWTSPSGKRLLPTNLLRPRLQNINGDYAYVRV